MSTDQRTHASLSGLFPENTATPPAEGNEATNREVARAILSGGPLPEGWNTDGLCRRSQELAARPREITLESLTVAYSTNDIDEAVNEALEEVIVSLDCGLSERDSDIANPIFIEEIRNAQRRTLERILRLVGERAPTVPPDIRVPPEDSPSDPLEIRLAREILKGADVLPSSPYDVIHLADAAADEANGASTCNNGKTVFTGLDGFEINATGPPEQRKTLVELSIREVLRFSEMVQGQGSPVRHSITFRHELHRCVNRELAHLLQEWGAFR